MTVRSSCKTTMFSFAATRTGPWVVWHKHSCLFVWAHWANLTHSYLCGPVWPVNLHPSSLPCSQCSWRKLLVPTSWPSTGSVGFFPSKKIIVDRVSSNLYRLHLPTLISPWHLGVWRCRDIPFFFSLDEVLSLGVFCLLLQLPRPVRLLPILASEEDFFPPETRKKELWTQYGYNSSPLLGEM